MNSKNKLYLGAEYDNIQNKTIAIVGVGGTGSTVAELISRTRPKKLILIDDDVVSESNLERQTLYYPKNMDGKKVFIAKDILLEFCEIDAFHNRLDSENIDLDVDLIIDCTDNIKTRLVINDYCIKKRIPWITTGVTEEFGQVFLITKDTPCFRCFSKEKEDISTEKVGVLSSAVALLGSLAATLAIKYLSSGEIENSLIRFNLKEYSLTKLKIKKDKNCICV